MLTIRDLNYRIAGRTLIDGASAQINAGWKVGLVGRNGAGKSTLLDLIRGERQSDGGEIRLQNDVRIGFVAQEAPGGATTPLEAVLGADEERVRLLAEADTTQDPHRIAEVQNRRLEIDAHAAPARAAGILHGLGFGAGFERISQELKRQKIAPPPEPRPCAYVVYFGKSAEMKDAAVQIVAELRHAGIKTEMGYGERSAKSQMKQANASGSAYAILIGEDEMAGGYLTVQDLRAGKELALETKQVKVPRDGIVEYLQKA